MRLASAVLAIALALVTLPFAARPVRADCAISLNEFLAGPARDWDGSGTFSTRDDEWVEVVNTAASACDLAGFYLTDGDSVPRYAFTGTLVAGGRRLVFGRDAYDWERATGHPAYGLSLGNTGDAVMLWRVVGAETLLVDSYRFKSHEAAADRAVGRVPEGGGAWALLDGLNPYTGTTPPLATGCVPTPGAVNVCDITPTRPSTWGRIKVLYR